MKGLMLKDFYLLVMRKQTIMLFMAIAVMMAFVQDTTFTIPYVTMLLSIWSLSTLSYDESNHGMTFLMSLPVSRKQYALEKYIFCMMTSICGWIFAVVISAAAALIKGQGPVEIETVFYSLIIIAFAVLSMDLMIPVQLKFGQEKSRFALIAIVCVICCAGYAVVEVAGDGEALAAGFDGMLATLSAPVIAAVVLLAAVVVTAISCSIAVMVLEHKEF